MSGLKSLLHTLFFLLWDADRLELSYGYKEQHRVRETGL